MGEEFARHVFGLAQNGDGTLQISGVPKYDGRDK
jgi:hypothetical protein